MQRTVTTQKKKKKDFLSKKKQEMQYVAPYPGQYIVPAEQYAPTQFIVEPGPQVIATPYGCGSCSSGKFGGGRKKASASVRSMADEMRDPYQQLAHVLAKNRMANPILTGKAAAKKRKYGGKRRSKSKLLSARVLRRWRSRSRSPRRSRR